MAGWIKVYRSITKHWIWENERYLKAWLTILMTVNFEPKKVLIRGELIECDRGQSLYSLSSWVKLFGAKWTIQRVRTLLNLLEKDEMIVLENLTKTTRLTVCNYESYQDVQHTDNIQTTHEQHAANTQPTRSQQQLKKDKNEKNEKNSKFVAPNSEEFFAYAKTLPTYKPSMEIKVKAKFDMWEGNGWRDGYDKPIKNWKTKLQTAITYFIEESKKNVYANPYKIQ